MTIGIDGNEANVENPVGVSVYTLNLLHYFKKTSSGDLKFQVFLKTKPLQLLPSEKQYFSYKIVEPVFLWSQLFLPLYLIHKKRVDGFFSPAHYAPRFCPAPSVVTVHDLSYFYYPKDFLKKDLHKLINWTRYSVKRAKKVIAVSKTTKQDLMKFYKLPEGKIEVIYNGYEKKIKSQSFDKLRIENWKLKIKNYILYVGTLQPRKNLPVLIKAFQTFKKENREFKLVIVGRKGWLYKEIFDLVLRLELKKDVVFTGFVEDDELVSLYKHAFCFVMPSLYEGFGIPILEAMSFGCPVVSSNASSLPEIGGDACIYFNPTQQDELTAKLKLLKENEKLRNELITKGEQRIKLFSWEKCAQKTLEVITSIV